jgi:hypothetical protein
MLLLILELLDAKFSRSFVSYHIIILLQVLLQEGAKTHDDEELTLAQITLPFPTLKIVLFQAAAYKP